MKTPQIEIPVSIEKLVRQIEAMEYFLSRDTDEFSRATHTAALEKLRASYAERSAS